MFAYVDTSVLVAAHVREPHTDLAQDWLSGQGGGLLLSTWALLECESALAIKTRRGEIDAEGQAQAIQDIEALATHFAPLAAPVEADYQHARVFCRNAASGLRAGDALHLAIALRLGACALATLDHVLASNSASHGIAPALRLPG